MDQKPKLSVTGYRAIWGKDLNEQIVFEYVSSFAKMVTENSVDKKNVKVLIGRDARQTGSKIFQSAKEALERKNIEVTYIGIIPIPTVLLLTKKLGFDGGIMITASHNPREYNGVKFIMPTGKLTNEKETARLEEIRKNLSEEDKTPVIKNTGLEEKVDNREFRKIHIAKILENIDAELIRSKNFKVALDPINSGGSIITQELLKELNCIVHVINGEPNGDFAHMPEPLPVNLEQIANAVIESKSDIGFAQDPDADRLVVIDEKGKVVLEEFSVVLATKSVLSRKELVEKENTVATNLSTTQVLKDVVEEYGGKLFRTKVGEANVIQKMEEVNACIGGEGSGGIMYPKVGYFRDSLSGIGLILELLARENKKISQIVESLPKYVMKKTKVTFTGDLNILYKDLETKFNNASINTLDGVRFDWPDSSWVHIRPSLTEPILRIFGEAKSEERIDALFQQVNDILI